MDPPEEQDPAGLYAVGDEARPEHLHLVSLYHDSVDDASLLASVARLRPGDPCFVRRSGGGPGGRFTCATVLSRQRGAVGGGEEEDVLFELQVDEAGATKVIPLLQSARYIRPWKAPSRDATPVGYRPARRAAQRRSSYHQGASMPQAHRHPMPAQRRSSQSASFHVTTHQTPAPSHLQGRRANHRASFHAGAPAPPFQRQPARSNTLRTSFHGGPAPQTQTNAQRRSSLHSDLKPQEGGLRQSQSGSNLRNVHPATSAQRRGSMPDVVRASFHVTGPGQYGRRQPSTARRHSSILTSYSRQSSHGARQQRPSWTTALSEDDAPEEASSVHPSSSSESSGSSGSSGSTSRGSGSSTSRDSSSEDPVDDSPRTSSPKSLDAKRVASATKVALPWSARGRGSSGDDSPRSYAKRASLPGGFDDVEFREASLLAAFQTISVKR